MPLCVAEALTPLVHVGTSEMPGLLGCRRADAWAGPKRRGSHLARQAERLRRQAAERGWRARCSPGRGVCKSRSLALSQTPCASRPCSGSSSVQFARVIFVVFPQSIFRSTVNLKLSFKMSLKTKHLKKKRKKRKKNLLPTYSLSVGRAVASKMRAQECLLSISDPCGVRLRMGRGRRIPWPNSCGEDISCGRKVSAFTWSR